MSSNTTCFMMNNYLFQNKDILVKKWHSFCILQISLVSGLTENSWMLTSASGFTLFQYAFSLTFLKEMQPHSVIAGKREHVLIGSEDNCGTFFSKLKQNLTNGSVLQVDRSKTWNCLNGFFCSLLFFLVLTFCGLITLKSFGLSCTLNTSFHHA